jgi:hypothetical protein
VSGDCALPPKDAARYLRMGLGKLQRLSHDNLIPCRNINPNGEKAVYRYSPKALDRWLEGEPEPEVSPSRSRIRANTRQTTTIRG